MRNQPFSAPLAAGGSALDAAVEGVLGRLGTRSAVALVAEGVDAFGLRAAATRAAGRTLDLQYYAWHGDGTGRRLAAEVLHAADRGVAVRLLLDDAFALGHERLLVALAEHPRIALRLFNGPRWRRLGWAGFVLELAFGGWHLNRRMHNKAWIADGRVAITGGRNLGDAYFDAASSTNFHDLDVVLAGDAVAGAAQVFERFWRSPLARPAGEVSTAAMARDALARLREEAEAAGGVLPAEAPGEASEAVARTMPGMIAVPEGRVRIVADPPTKAERGPSRWRLRRMRGGLAPEIAEALAGARREALLISPYFVPGREGAALLAGLVRRGVRVSVVTNSLAATDVPAVHGGYARYRRRLLEDGVELHEVKHLGPGQTPNRLSRRILGSSGVSLHSKAMVVDGAEGFVGSFNLDPRSAALNTEMGVAVRHPGFAAAIAGEHARLAAPAAAWRVTLEGGRLAWRDGAAWHATEPGASRLRRATAFMAWLLPVEGQL